MIVEVTQRSAEGGRRALTAQRGARAPILSVDLIGQAVTSKWMRRT